MAPITPKQLTEVTEVLINYLGSLERVQLSRTHSSSSGAVSSKIPMAHTVVSLLQACQADSRFLWLTWTNQSILRLKPLNAGTPLRSSSLGWQARQEA